MSYDEIIGYVARFLAILLVLPLHEFAHAFAAVKNGDSTPKISGRYTLNPLKHFDPIGFVMIMLVGFGWAKPVPINPYNFKSYRKGYFQVSIAGVVANYICAFLVYPLVILSFGLFAYNIPVLATIIYNTLYFIFAISLALFVFNLIPVYPLDGFRVFEVATKRRGKIYNFLRNYGYMVLLGLMILSVIANYINFPYLNIFGFFMRFATDIIGWPIQAFWGLFF